MTDAQGFKVGETEVQRFLSETGWVRKGSYWIKAGHRCEEAAAAICEATCVLSDAMRVIRGVAPESLEPCIDIARTDSAALKAVP